MIKKACDKLTAAITAICGVIIAAIVIIIVAHIILRALGHPIKGQTEMVQYLTMTMAVLMLSRTCFEDKHIYVTIFTDHLPKVVRKIALGIGRILGAVVIATMAVKCFQNMSKSAIRTSEVLKIPYTLLLTIMAVGLTLSAIMFIVQGGMHFASIKEEKHDPSGETINGFRDDNM